jgi:hypothetical protein
MHATPFEASLSADSRFGVPSRFELPPAALPADDPVERLRAEEAHDSSLLRHVLSAALAVFALALASRWLG